MAFSSSVGWVSFSRNPLAPARRAWKTYSSRSNVVRTSTRVAAVRSSAAMRRVASMPSTPGMRMSMSTTSGLVGHGQLDRLGPVGRLADHLEAVLALDEDAEAGPHQGLVVGQQDADHGAATGANRSVAATR